jgi:hypothetical protein
MVHCITSFGNTNYRADSPRQHHDAKGDPFAVESEALQVSRTIFRTRDLLVR